MAKTTTARRDGVNIVIERGGRELSRAPADVTDRLLDARGDKAAAAAIRTMKRGPGGVATSD